MMIIIIFIIIIIIINIVFARFIQTVRLTMDA
jgi:hypothetical protein